MTTYQVWSGPDESPRGLDDPRNVIASSPRRAAEQWAREMTYEGDLGDGDAVAANVKSPDGSVSQWKVEVSVSIDAEARPASEARRG